MDPSVSVPDAPHPRGLPDEVLEQVVGGAGPIAPDRLAALLRSGPDPAPGLPAGGR